MFSSYSAKIENQKIVSANENYSGINYMLVFSEKIKTTIEEVYIVDGLDLLSSVGGALGLFIGFSFYGRLSILLDILLTAK